MLLKRLNQSLLAKVALEGKFPRVAISKLTDQSLLAKVAIEGADTGGRNAAATKLTDQSLLAKVALEGVDGSVGGDVVLRLTDEALLARVAQEGKNEDVRKAAMMALAGGETVESGREVYVWRTAAEKGGEASRARLKIGGALGDADLNGDILGD